MTLPLLLALPLLGCLVVGLLPRRAERLAVPLGVGFTGATLAGSLALAAAYDADAPVPPGTLRPQLLTDVSWIPAIGARILLGVDGVSLPLVLLTALLTFLCAVWSLRFLPPGGSPKALVALLLLLEVGMLGSFLALDLLLFFVFFEVVLVPMYFLIAGWGGERRAAAGLKFFLYTLLGSAFLLVGLLVVALQADTWSLIELTARQGSGLSRTVQLLAFLGLFVGFAIKAPMWPLHTWLPDAHTEAPTIGSVLLAGVLLKLGTYGLVRIALPVLPEGARAFAPYLGVLAVVAIVWGCLCCLAQRDLKRLIAFSSLGHIGFVLLGIATLTPTGVNAALFGNVAHGVITGLLFFLVGAVKERYGTTDLAELGGGLLGKSPWLGGTVTLAAVASLGLPGLAGFWGEVLALLAAYRPAEGLPRGLFLVLLGVGALGTVLTAAYFLVLLQRLTLGAVPPARRSAPLADATAVDLVVWAPLVVLLVALGVWPRLLLGLTDAPVRALLGG